MADASEVPPTAPRPADGGGTGLRLWLVRHAEVDEAWRGRAYGDLDVPLSPEGLEVTDAMGAAFAGAPVARVYASPLSRALAMGESVAKAAEAELTVRDGLREIHRGTWQGRPTDEIGAEDPEGVAAYYADPWGYTGHGGETDERILARVLPVIAEAREAHPGRTVVFATHYNVIRVAVAHALGVEPAHSFRIRVDTGRAVLLEDREDGFVLRASNVVRPARELLTA